LEKVPFSWNNYEHFIDGVAQFSTSDILTLDMERFHVARRKKELERHRFSHIYIRYRYPIQDPKGSNSLQSGTLLLYFHISHPAFKNNQYAKLFIEMTVH
jgi:hypothetical protein